MGPPPGDEDLEQSGTDFSSPAILPIPAQVGQRANDSEDLDQPPTKKVVREDVDDGDEAEWADEEDGASPTLPQGCGSAAGAVTQEDWAEPPAPASECSGLLEPSVEDPLYG